jgi:hypothetical protein
MSKSKLLLPRPRSQSRKKQPPNIQKSLKTPPKSGVFFPLNKFDISFKLLYDPAMDKVQHLKFKELIVAVFDEAVAVLVVEEGFDHPGLSVEERRSMLTKRFAAVALCEDPAHKDEILAFIACENELGTEEGVTEETKKKPNNFTLFQKLQKDLEGPESVRNAELALRFLSAGYELLKMEPDIAPN